MVLYSLVKSISNKNENFHVFLTASSSRAGAVLVMAFSCVYSKSWSIKFHKHKMSNIMVNQISYYSVHIKIMVNQISLEVFI